MTVKKCDKCGKEADVVSVLTLQYWADFNVAEDDEPLRFVKQIRKHKYDLCEECALKFAESIEGRPIAKTLV